MSIPLAVYNVIEKHHRKWLLHKWFGLRVAEALNDLRDDLRQMDSEDTHMELMVLRAIGEHEKKAHGRK